MPGSRNGEIRAAKAQPGAAGISGKNVMLVDDSIVRGTTCRQIIEMAREAGARQGLLRLRRAPVRYPNVYGIDMPTRSELIAAGRTDEEIALEIGADALVYQDVDALKADYMRSIQRSPASTPHASMVST